MWLDEKYLDKSKLYIVGVSGGCDSMALLDCLYQKNYQLLVCHVNYNFRDDTDQDYKIVSDYCASRDIPFYYKEFHHDDYSQGNFQAQARDLRYSFYQEIYFQYHCEGVILAHHQDDYIESVYMQLEGHHTMYYLGIRDYSTVKNMTIIRPLLKCYKQDILDYCKTHEIAYHDDYTNFQTDFERDRVRNTILNRYTIQDKQILIDRAKSHNQRIKEMEDRIKPYYDFYKDHHQINYYDIPNELRSFFLFVMLKDIMDPRRISASLIKEIEHQIHSDKPNIQMNLPVNYLFIKEYDNIYTIDKEKVKPYSYVFNEFTLFTCEHFHLSKNGHINEGVYLSKEDYPITIRTIREGDRIVTSGGTKKLSRLFINAKIPALKRKSWPVVVNSQGIIVLVPLIAKNIDYLTTKPNVFVIK